LGWLAAAAGDDCGGWFQGSVSQGSDQLLVVGWDTGVVGATGRTGTMVGAGNAGPGVGFEATVIPAFIGYALPVGIVERDDGSSGGAAMLPPMDVQPVAVCVTGPPITVGDGETLGVRAGGQGGGEIADEDGAVVGTADLVPGGGTTAVAEEGTGFP
jgi:hypothetical protein